MILGATLIGAGLLILFCSYSLFCWTALVRRPSTPEPRWVTPTGCGTSALAMILCTAGTIVSALSVL